MTKIEFSENNKVLTLIKRSHNPIKHDLLTTDNFYPKYIFKYYNNIGQFITFCAYYLPNSTSLLAKRQKRIRVLRGGIVCLVEPEDVEIGDIISQNWIEEKTYGRED